MFPTVRRFLVLLLSGALTLSACGGDSGPDPAEDPKGALTAALEKLGEYEGITATVSLDSDTGSLVAASEGELTEELAQVILDSSLAITSKSGDKPEDAQAEFVADIAGDRAELRVVEETLYARADVAELVARFEGDPAELDQFRQQAPPGFEFVGTLLDGDWIAITGAQEFAEQFAEQFGGPIPSEEEAAEFQKELADKLSAAFEDNATVESVGSDDVGDHLEARIALRGLYEAFVELMQSAPGIGTLPPGTFPPASEVPDEELTVDAWIDGGDLVQIAFDFLKIAETFEAEPAPPGVENLGLRIQLEEFTGDVEAPDAADTVDFQQIFQGLLGAGIGSGSGSMEVEQPDLGELCSQLEGAPPEVVEQFAEECPELQQ
jgi:hypothetical protein